MRIEVLALYILVFIASQIIIIKHKPIQNFLQRKTGYVLSYSLLGLTLLLVIGAFLPVIGQFVPMGTIFIFSLIYKRYYILFEHNEKRFV